MEQLIGSPKAYETPPLLDTSTRVASRGSGVSAVLVSPCFRLFPLPSALMSTRDHGVAVTGRLEGRFQMAVGFSTRNVVRWFGSVNV